MKPKSRRQLLALAGTAAATVVGGTYALASRRQPHDNGTEPSSDPHDPSIDLEFERPELEFEPDSSSDTPSDAEEPTREESRSVRGENIRDHGAVSNPDDSSVEEAIRNLEAIIGAMNAAGEGGAVYVPAGTYYFGGEHAPFFEFGDREPAGISLYGDGPTRSVLGISRTNRDIRSPSDDWTGFYYDDKGGSGHGVDHGTVRFEHIKLDGNYEHLPNLSEAGGASRGIDVHGDGEFHLYNVHLRGWYQNSFKGRTSVGTVTYCTFEDTGIGRHNDTDGGSISHHTSIRPSKGETSLVARCHFIDCAGSAINWGYHDGTLKIRNCYVEGTGANFMKLSAGGILELRNIYHIANTDSLEEKIKERPDGHNFWGRNFIQSLHERGEKNVTIDSKNVVSREIREYAIQSRNTSTITWKGDLIAFHNINTAYDNEVIRARSGGKFADIDINRLSVHNTNGVVFDLDKANGSINELHRSGTEGLGQVDNLVVNSDNNGANPFEPPHPTPREVGINTIPWEWEHSVSQDNAI